MSELEQDVQTLKTPVAVPVKKKQPEKVEKVRAFGIHWD